MLVGEGKASGTAHVEEPHIITVQGVDIELRVDASLVPSTLRAFAGMTPMDAEVDALPIPTAPLWLYICIRLLRGYRSTIAPRIGQRCGYEPSCSRYSELAFRRHGFMKGFRATLGRLGRCRPGTGGVDNP